MEKAIINIPSRIYKGYPIVSEYDAHNAFDYLVEMFYEFCNTSKISKELIAAIKSNISDPLLKNYVLETSKIFVGHNVKDKNIATNFYHFGKFLNPQGIHLPLLRNNLYIDARKILNFKYIYTKCLDPNYRFLNSMEQKTINSFCDRYDKTSVINE